MILFLDPIPIKVVPTPTESQGVQGGFLLARSPLLGTRGYTSRICSVGTASGLEKEAVQGSGL